MDEPDPTQPLLVQAYNDHDSVRHNMANLIRTLLMSSLIFIYISILFSSCKIVLAITAGILEFGSCDLGIVLWVMLSAIFDGMFLAYCRVKPSLNGKRMLGDIFNFQCLMNGVMKII